MAYKKEMIIVSIFSTIIVFIVATYAFFTTEVSSAPGALSTSTASFSLSLEVTPEFYHSNLIPMDNNLAITGYNNDCIDSNQFNVCQAYEIKITNTAGTGQHERLSGVIRFNLNNVVNLSYMLLDADGVVYKSATAVGNGTDLSLGDFVELDDGEYKTFTLIIWLSNLANQDQSNVDANGSFNAAVTYTSVRGEDLSTTITGTIN